MNGIIYYTKIRDEYNGKNMEHMIGEKLLEIGLEREFGRKLAFEPRSKGEHGVTAVGEGCAGSETGRNLPIIPESVRHESGNARLLRRSFGKCGRGESHEQNSQENLSHNIHL